MSIFARLPSLPQHAQVLLVPRASADQAHMTEANLPPAIASTACTIFILRQQASLLLHATTSPALSTATINECSALRGDSTLSSNSAAEAGDAADEARLDALLCAQLDARRVRQSRARVVLVDAAPQLQPQLQPPANSAVQADSSGVGSSAGTAVSTLSSSFSNLLKHELGGNTQLAWCFELMRSGFNAQAPSLIVFELDNDEDEDRNVESAEGGALHTCHEGAHALSSTLENAIALAAPGSTLALVSSRAGASACVLAVAALAEHQFTLVDRQPDVDESVVLLTRPA